MKKIDSILARPSTQCWELFSLLSHNAILKLEQVSLFSDNINCLILTFLFRGIVAL